MSVQACWGDGYLAMLFAWHAWASRWRYRPFSCMSFFFLPCNGIDRCLTRRKDSASPSWSRPTAKRVKPRYDKFDGVSCRRTGSPLFMCLKTSEQFCNFSSGSFLNLLSKKICSWRSNARRSRAWSKLSLRTNFAPEARLLRRLLSLLTSRIGCLWAVAMHGKGCTTRWIALYPHGLSRLFCVGFVR